MIDLDEHRIEGHAVGAAIIVLNAPCGECLEYTRQVSCIACEHPRATGVLLRLDDFEPTDQHAFGTFVKGVDEGPRDMSRLEQDAVSIDADLRKALVGFAVDRRYLDTSMEGWVRVVGANGLLGFLTWPNCD